MDEKHPKVGRTVKLEHEMNNRLIALCEHLGVNPNAYLLNEIGKAVSRDEVAYKASKQTADMTNLLEALFSETKEQIDEAIDEAKEQID